jgi:hypothetical protein
VLRARAQFVIDELRVARAVYLGADGALDELVRRWAGELVGGEPADDAAWERAASACATASHDGIDAFLRAERRRQALRVLECLPHASARSIELFHDKVVAVLIHDKALLDKEDMLPAAILAFGRSSEPLVHRVGQRTFVSPGPAAHPRGGVAMLDDDQEGTVSASIFAPDGTRVLCETVASAAQVARLTVQGASSS